MKILVTEISGATFTSYKPFESELSVYIKHLTFEQVAMLKLGNSVSFKTYNRVGTATTRILKKID